MKTEALETTYGEEEANQKDMFHCESPVFSISSRLLSDNKLYKKRLKKIKKESKDAVDIKALLKKIKHFATTEDEAIHHIKSARSRILNKTVILNIGIVSIKDQILGTSPIEDKKSILQNKKETDNIAQNVKGIMHSHVIIAMDWNTMQIIVFQDQTDSLLKKSQVSLEKQDKLCKVGITADYPWASQQLEVGNRMASKVTTHLLRFNSHWQCPTTEAVNCFTQD
ncbi:9857_t:CDS:2 [Cetraspora pellucida]|uniref:9857_t:CDS:1 n=1 Tax=Cetraspora pellucida TaxID=1433469 RepID=A0A9N9BCE4_9GLOM|nr:9857_t:CDS:2 [Cetraspora pellucida]